MAIFRRRLLFWLIKAYIKKSGKIFVLSFIAGLLVFFGLVYIIQNASYRLPTTKKEVVGIVGAYSTDNLPSPIVSNISHGLTEITETGEVKPDVAASWQITNNGKTYTFYLRDGLMFSNGNPVTSYDINHNFKDVTVEQPDSKTITFKLKDAYAPFLITTSRPIFKKGAVGIGDHEIDNIELNGNFVKSLRIVNTKNRLESVEYKFYPTEEALKIAFLLGEISKAIGVTNDEFKDQHISSFTNVQARKDIDYSQLVTLFYNTQDPVLSDKKIRGSLGYALPDSISFGERVNVPYPPQTWFYNEELISRSKDIDHAQLLLTDAMEQASMSAPLRITLKTLSKYEPTASIIKQEWEKIGVVTTIEEVDRVPAIFQIYLGDFTVPKDPDQYTLWHSDQVNNITKFKNLRIDKLLEDGRKIHNRKEREEIYKDFQKYLLDEAPAAFLYFPYQHVITRR